MSEKSTIQWTDATWNIARGCTKVDEDCKFCYMYRDSFDSTRYDPLNVVRTKTVFHLPMRIKYPAKIFTCSLTDFFHEDIDSYRNEAWDIIRRCPQHTFQILTKRPERIVACLPADWGTGWDNVWLGTSVGSNKAIERMHIMAQIPAVVRFISFEPLHGRIETNWDLSEIMAFQWVILGGESGNETGKYRYRPCEIGWLEELKDAFDSCGVAVFVKQMGTHLSKVLGMTDRHGGNIEEFPLSLRIRKFPNT
jgi:protein gp37